MTAFKSLLGCCFVAGAALALPNEVVGQAADPLASIPSLATLIGQPKSELAGVIDRYAADRRSLLARYDAEGSLDQRTRMRGFFDAWRKRLREVDFDGVAIGDHFTAMEGGGRASVAYTVGYMKALLLRANAEFS